MDANLARARLQTSQAEQQLKNSELQVVTQVRNVARQVTTNSKLVESTRAARVLQEQRLDAEQKKLAAGTSTNFLVFQAQRDLAQARNDELNAILNYNRALVDLETVQVAPVVGSGTATLATATAAGINPGATTQAGTAANAVVGATTGQGGTGLNAVTGATTGAPTP
jgi:2-phospho-L-lactate guanylyltransferase (CobY/MobA/RfbA family)